MYMYVWFVVNKYYCSETTTTQVCLGYMSRLSQSNHAYMYMYMALMTANQPETAVRHLLCLLCAYLFFHIRPVICVVLHDMYMCSPYLHVQLALYMHSAYETHIHIWWGQTSYIVIPGQRCFELTSSH